MGKRKPYVVAGIEFGAQKELIAHIQTQILYAYPLEQTLERQHFVFLRDLLEHHENADEKIGIGVARMWIRMNPQESRGFWLERADRTQTDWSFYSCIRKTPPDGDFKAACRTGIVEQKLAFRARAFAERPAIPCAVSGVLVTPDTCHVDHEPPSTFDALVQAFVASEGIDVTRVQIRGYEDGATAKMIADPVLLARWRAFHERHWRPRITTPGVNLSAPRASGRR